MNFHWKLQLEDPMEDSSLITLTASGLFYLHDGDEIAQLAALKNKSCATQRWWRTTDRRRGFRDQ
jgi:hypothetical protein